MDYKIYSYRFAQEIIQHEKHRPAYNDIITVVEECPLYIYPNKSESNRKLDVVQQLLNTYFDVKLACEHSWDYHPDATSILDSELAADFRKSYNGLRIQAEVQFGNMARWYSDIFKFQTAYSQGLIDMGLSIVPLNSIANRIDSNITYYERCIRELPSAVLSITLPILMIGVELGAATQVIDVSTAGFQNIGSIKTITGENQTANRYRIVNGILRGQSISLISDVTDCEPMAARPKRKRKSRL